MASRLPWVKSSPIPISRRPCDCWRKKDLGIFTKAKLQKQSSRHRALWAGPCRPGDLAEFSSEWVDPISIDYRGWRVYELPPNGQGMAALEMLNIMAMSQPDKLGPQGAVELHKKIEAMKLAYTDLYRYNGDPRFASIPVRGLLSKEYCGKTCCAD